MSDSGSELNVHFYCRDFAGDAAKKRRTELLQAHLDFVAANVDHVRVAGPLYDENRAGIVGSCLIYRADSVSAARALFDQDPYAACGEIWETVEVRVFRDVAGTWIGGCRW